MNDPTRDPLDQAIDRVAARLVSVDHDEAIVDRIVARLPERSGAGGWRRVLMPQAAIATALIIAALVWTTRNREQVDGDPVATPSVADAGVAAREVPAAPASVGAVAAPPTASRVAAPRVTEAETASVALADHERSLEPVAALVPLEVVSLASPPLLEEAPVVLSPIVLNDLPLSGEPNSPR